MLRMIEAVGTSERGFSEAAEDAVNRLVQAGEKIHFFQIVEQRGAVRDGILHEFQVILKAACEQR